MANSLTYFIARHPEQDGEFLIPEGRQKNIESAFCYKARANDLFICSYPKCGTTWLQNIVWRILHGGQPFPGILGDHISFLEFDGEEAVYKTTEGEDISVIKTHFPYHWIPKHKDAKYIYIAREPKDVCVSLYYHNKGFPNYKFDGTFDDIFEKFYSGKANCWDYFHMLMDWYAVKDNPNVLFLLYENLHSDTENEILKIAKFLGDKYESDMTTENNKILQKIVEETAIQKMREQDDKWTRSKRTAPFIRKGIMGDWKSHMTSEQSEKIDKKLEKIANDNGCEKLWKQWT